MLSQGLNSGKFFDTLSLNPPKAFHALLGLAELYINLEDTKRLKKEERVPAPSDGGRKDGKNNQGPSHIVAGQDEALAVSHPGTVD